MSEKSLSPIPSTINRILQSEESIQLRIIEAHNEAEARLIAAHEEAAYIRKTAEQQGKKLHDEQYQNMLVAARQEASLIVARARTASRDMKERGKTNMTTAVDWVVDMITRVGDNDSL